MNNNNEEISSLSENENSLDNELNKSSKYIINNLENIKESEEITLMNPNQNKEIKNLKQTIIELESKISHLQKRNNELTKENIRNDSKLKRISFVGVRKNFLFDNKINNFKITELNKEKNDLQEINERMLNILTEKEIEISELNENINNLKNDKKKSEENYNEKIEYLEKKIEKMEEYYVEQENFEQNLQEIMDEYNKYKSKTENIISEKMQSEEELKEELIKKENEILDIKNKIKNLEFENNQLKGINEDNKDKNDMNLLLIENEKLKNENLNLIEKMKSTENYMKKNIAEKDEEINSIKQELETNSQNLLLIQKEKNDEISNLKSEKIKNSKDIIDLIQKNDLLQKENNELKANILTIQKKFEQKSKELEELNSVTKKLIQNKENTIIQYENELEMKNKEKNLLISQNKELLNKLNNGNNDKEEHKGNENYLLNEEIKSLKEQLEKQAHDLLSLDAMEKQISELQLENENLKKKEQGKTSDDSNNDLLTNSVKLKQNLSSNIDNSPIKKVKKRLSITILKDKNNNINDKTNNDTIILEKKAMTIAPKENDKINENEDIIKKENEQLKDEITKLKVKYFNSEFEKDTKITKFKNILKNIEQQCQKLGVTINLNFDKI